MLNPIELNQISVQGQTIEDEFPLTWVEPEDGINIGFANIGSAWNNDQGGVSLPVAILPTNIHPRMSVQRSCFTVHGKCKRPLSSQVSKDSGIVREYRIDPNARHQMRSDLQLLGISHSTVFPDLIGLAQELRELY